MTKKNSSRSTKLVMASALAMSAFVPALAVGAEEVQAPLFKEYKNLKDGSYNVTFDAYKLADYSPNYKAISGQFNTSAVLEVEDGKYYAIIETKESSASLIEGLSVGDSEGEIIQEPNDTFKTKKFKVEISNPTELTSSAVEVRYPNGIMTHTFGFVINSITAPVYVYKYNETTNTATDELSIMGTYINPDVKVYTGQDGYDVELTFAQGQYVVDFDVPGTETSLVSETPVEGSENVIKIYKIHTQDYSQLFESTMTINVPQVPGYENLPHTVQLQFGGQVKSPFTDLTSGDWAEDYILGLYSKGIFKYDSSFRPGNVTERYQLALMLQRAFKYNVPAGNPTFTDLPSYFDTETKNAIKALSSANIIKGLDAAGTQFGPTKSISRQDAAIMISRVLTEKGLLPKENVTLPYNDYTSPAADSTDAYALEIDKALKHLNGYGIMSGDQNGNINATNTLTRAEMAKILSVSLELLKTQN